jgi:hypothetical protein
MPETLTLFVDENELPSFSDLDFKRLGARSWTLNRDALRDFLEDSGAENEAIVEILASEKQTLSAVIAWYQISLRRTGVTCEDFERTLKDYGIYFGTQGMIH